MNTSLDVSTRPAFALVHGGHGNTCHHTPAEILRMLKARLKDFDNEQLAAANLLVSQEHNTRSTVDHH